MANASEAADEYRSTLAELSNNNKTQINLLTILAEDYQSFSADIVDVIEERIREVAPPQKLAVLYVADSVVKNVHPTGNYRELFARNIVRTFVHVFDTGDERTRAALYKLRLTWTDIFPRGKLYAIDIKANEIDPNWPLITPPSSTASRTTTTAGAKIPSSSSTATTTTTTSTSSSVVASTSSSAGSTTPPNAHIHVNPKFMPPPKMEPVSPKRKNDDGDTKQRDHRKEEVVPTKRDKKKDETPAPKKERKVDDESKKRKSGHSSKKSKRTRVGDSTTTDSTMALVSSTVAELPDTTVEEKTHTGRQHSPLFDKRRMPIASSSSSRPSGGPFQPTATPGQHAFISAPSQLRSSGLLPAPPVVVNPPVAPFVGGAPPMMSTFMQHGMPQMAPIVMPPQQPSVIITTDQPKLDGIPANNRIFVDGKAYEVFYIDDVAVILRNTLPHRIYFTGPPRNVIIDGVAHSLAFGDRKSVTIDGQQHVLRFGAPSRELYMGHYAFRGAFGGPPIYATINGVRHEIRLSGTPPEVRIEPDPSYELLRHINQLHPSNQSQAAGGPVVGAYRPMIRPDIGAAVGLKTDIGTLLKSLQQRGLIPGKKDAQSHNHRPQQRPPTPPIPSEHRLETVERQFQPPTSLKDFSMRSLKIRYQAVIDALYQIHQRCPNCGLRFDDLKGEKYQRHLDWHFKEKVRARDGTRGRSRQWYLVVDDWINYSELDENESLSKGECLQRVFDNNFSAKSDVFDENARANLDDDNVVATVAVSDVEGPQECAACSEKFDVYWDEDDDVWKLKNCSLFGGKAYHPTCYQDVSGLERSISYDASILHPLAAVTTPEDSAYDSDRNICLNRRAPTE